MGPLLPETKSVVYTNDLSVSVVLHLSTLFAGAIPFDKPPLSISEAATLAETELARRGLARDHFIVSLWLTPAANGQSRYYNAHITPPVPYDASLLGTSTTPDRILELHIDMNGVVTTSFHEIAHEILSPPRRLKLEVEVHR
jgi:hypothetical protein